MLNDLGAPLKLDWKVLCAASPYHQILALLLFSTFVAFISKGYRSINSVLLFVPVLLCSGPVFINPAVEVDHCFPTLKFASFLKAFFSLPPLVPAAAAFSQLRENWGADLGPLQAAKDEEELEEVVASSAVAVV